MSPSVDQRDPVEALAEEFMERKRRGEAAHARGIRRSLSRARRRDPRPLPGARDDGEAGQRVERRAPASIAGIVGSGRGREDREARRLPHPPRDRPRRHGRRLRGRAGLAGPPGGAEGAAVASRSSTRSRSGGSSARRRRRPGCTTRTSCRSSASASRTGITTTSCSSSRARAWTLVLDELRRLKKSRSGFDHAPRPLLRRDVEPAGSGSHAASARRSPISSD